MHRIVLFGGLGSLLIALGVTGCGQQGTGQQGPQVAQLAPEGSTPPGTVPPGEAKPIPGQKTNPDEPKDPSLPLGPRGEAEIPGLDVKTDPELLPALPTLTAPTGQAKYEAALSKAFSLLSEKKDAEALAALQEAQAAQESDFVKTEIERVKGRLASKAAAEKTALDIETILGTGRAADASKLADDALAQYGETDLAPVFSRLKRQADAVLSTQLEEKGRKEKFLADAEAARKASNYRGALIAYEQAVAQGADVAPVKDQYEDLRVKVAKYDENRNRAAEVRRDPYKLEESITFLKTAAQAWDTQQVRQEIADAEAALHNRKDRVTVADFEVINDIGIPRAGHAIAEEVLPHFRPRFEILERAQMQSVFNELKIEQSSLYQGTAPPVELARVTKARYIVLGSVSRLSGIVVNARVVELQTGVIVQTARIVATTPAEMTQRLPVLARMLQMNDLEKRQYEQELAERSKPVPVIQPAEFVPDAPVAPAPEVAAPAPIIIQAVRPPEFGRVVVADFNGFRVIEVGAVAPPPIVIIDAAAQMRNRSLFLHVEVGDNFYRRGLYREALRHYEFALTIMPQHPGIRIRLERTRPFCPPPIVVIRPRLIILPFAEFRDPFNVPSTIPIGLGVWTADNIAPHFAGSFDVVDRGEVYWWMGRLGLSVRDVLTDPHARLILARSLGARHVLMGSLREVASFDVTTHLIDAELNVQQAGAKIRVQNAFQLRGLLDDLAALTVTPLAQQAVIVQQVQQTERVVERARIEIGGGRFKVGLELIREEVRVRPNSVVARQTLIEFEFRNRQAELEAARIAQIRQREEQARLERERQIALAAAAQAARLEAERQAAASALVERERLRRQQALAQTQLVQQAEIHIQGRRFGLAIGVLESASAIQPTPTVVNRLAFARTQQAELERTALAEQRAAQEAATRVQRERELEATRLALAQEQERRVKAEQAAALEAQKRQQAEYDNFVDQGQTAMAKGNFAAASAAFMNARKIKPSPEIEKLVTASLTEQARADAQKKGAEERKRLEKQLADEEARRKGLEEENARLKAKYDTALARGRAAFKEKKFTEAVEGFRLASNTIRTDEALTALRQSEDEVAKAKAADESAQKAKLEAERQKKITDGLVTEARAASTAKNFDKAISLFKQAAQRDPSSVDIQKELAVAEQAKNDALLAARKQREEAEKKDRLQTVLANANRSLTNKQYDSAIVAFKEALTLDPNSNDAKTGLANAEKAQSAMLVDAAAQAEAKKKRALYEDQLGKGRAALELKQYDAAIANFDAALKTIPNDPAATQGIATAKKLRDDAEADRIAKQKAATIAQLLNQTKVALQASQYDNADQLIGKVLALDATHAEAKKLQADSKAGREAYAAAIKKKDDMTKKSQKVATLLADARKALAAKDLENAGKALAAAAVEDPTDPDVKRVEGEYQTLRTSMAAEAKTREAYNIAMKKGTDALALKNFEGAITSAQEALRLRADDPTALKLLADARKGQADVGMMADMEKKRQYDAFIKAGQGALATGKYDDAIANANAAAKVIPTGVEAKTLLADATKAKDNAMAGMKVKEQYDNAIKAAQAALNAKKFDDAIAQGNAALKLNPAGLEAKAIVAEATKQRDAMMAAMKTKDQFDAWVKAAQASLAAKKYEDAAAQADAALKIMPNDPTAKALFAEAIKQRDAMMAAMKTKEQFDAWVKAAQGSLAAKKFDDAIAQAGNALKLMPKDPTAQAILDEATKQRDTMNAAMKNKEQYDAFVKAAQGSLTAKKFDDAIAQANAALKLNPAGPEAKIILGEATKQRDAAMAAMKNKEQFDAWVKAAQGSIAAKKYDDAVGQANAALKLIPGDPTATALLKQAQAGQAEMANAAAIRRQYEGEINKGNAAMAGKQYQAAVDAYTAALKIIPNDPVATKGLNDARAALNPPKKDPVPPKKDPVPPKKDPVPMVKVEDVVKEAAALEAQGKFDAALQKYQEASKLSPTDNGIKSKITFTSWVVQGQRDLNAGKFAEAQASFEQALKIAPTDANVKRLLDQAKAKKK